MSERGPHHSGRDDEVRQYSVASNSGPSSAMGVARHRKPAIAAPQAIESSKVNAETESQHLQWNIDLGAHQWGSCNNDS